MFAVGCVYRLSSKLIRSMRVRVLDNTDGCLCCSDADNRLNCVILCRDVCVLAEVYAWQTNNIRSARFGCVCERRRNDADEISGKDPRFHEHKIQSLCVYVCLLIMWVNSTPIGRYRGTDALTSTITSRRRCSRYFFPRYFVSVWMNGN